jgi:kynurenine formamidase
MDVTELNPLGPLLRDATLIDLSMPIEAVAHDPAVMRRQLWRHQDGGRRIGRKAAFNRRLPLAARLARAAGYLSGRRRIDADCFPDGEFLGNEIFTLSVHAGSHMDAPFHYGRHCEGSDARRIDEVPLDWCVGDGVLLRFTGLPPRAEISADDVAAELQRIGHELQPGEIVLIHTGADRLWPDPAYFTAHPGMSVGAIRYLTERGVKIIGIDTAGFDLPAPVMIERFYRTRDPACLWPCHLYGREREYLQIERMGGLDRISRQTGFTVICPPIRVSGAGAAWVRPLAIVAEESS